MDQQVKVRLAVTTDFEALQPLFTQYCDRMAVNFDQNFKPVASSILADTSKGIVLMAESGSKPVGFTMFTYEWSDWRDGVFYWIQASQAEPSAEKAIRDFLLNEYKGKYRFCGVRLSARKN